ncbi:bifunctional Telomerase reverse transcriptase/Reverse transcriptase domain/Telomerase ribonucleoprotein complex - RNA-binding domain [Babesia duncani]|uniref:Telomerase reverse transcriptase n=1 Tax=Babesia duncani TaxID=323732 RepID=A0AAD9UNK4_9APIC|nr:bifunctional Telomerase reverse transcriptase/Reverse transcriptase domain/Telomerase ribonucleoprotein complex - RNA-binding domain [Babesia duncani]
MNLSRLRRKCGLLSRLHLQCKKTHIRLILYNNNEVCTLYDFSDKFESLDNCKAVLLAIVSKCIIIQRSSNNKHEHNIRCGYKCFGNSPRSQNAPEQVPSTNTINGIDSQHGQGSNSRILVPINNFIQEPLTVFETVLGRGIMEFLGKAAIKSLVEDYYIFVPMPLIRMANDETFVELLRGSSSNIEQKKAFRILLSYFGKIKGNVCGKVSQLNPFLYIQCSKNAMTENIKETKGSWSSIVLSRHLIRYSDSFNKRFGLSKKGVLGNIDSKNPRDIWNLVKFTLYDKNIIASNLHLRYQSKHNFLISKLDACRLKIKSHTLKTLCAHFTSFIDNLNAFDWKAAYRKHIYSTTTYNGGHRFSIYHNCIYRFLKCCLCKCVPIQMVGGLKNFRRLLQVTRSLVSLTKNETLNMSQVMKGVGLKNVDWSLKSQGRHSKSQTRQLLDYLCRIFFLLLEHLVIPILRRHFYVTESNYTRYRIMYFSKFAWQKMVRRASLGFVDTKEDISCSDLRRRFMKVRWLPKTSGMRPLVNCKVKKVLEPFLRNIERSHRNGTICKGASQFCYKCWLFKKWNNSDMKYYMSLNEIMVLPTKALTLNCRLNPRLLQHGVYSYGSIHKALHKWWVRILKWKRSGNSGHPLHVLVADLHRFYDLIPHDDLFEAIEQIPLFTLRFQLAHRQSLIQISSETNCNWLSLYVLEQVQGSGTTNIGASRLDKIQKQSLYSQVFTEASIIASRHKRNWERICISKEDVLTLLKPLISSFTIKLPKISPRIIYKSDAGIPQGCRVSTILANLYLANKERTDEFQCLINGPEPSTFLRWSDNILFLSPSRDKVEKMEKLLRDGSHFKQGQIKCESHTKSIQGHDNTRYNKLVKIQTWHFYV